jgi:hypothetical protein
LIPIFYKKNKVKDSSTFTFTSANEDLAYNLYDRKLNTSLRSIGSNDATPEVWVIEFETAQPVDTILTLNHNIKSGKIEYWDGDSWEDFSTPIAWSSNAEIHNHFTFTSVSTDKIRLTLNTTMTVNAQKTMAMLWVLESIGSVDVGPSAITREFKEDSVSHVKAGAGNLYTFFGSKMEMRYRFSDADADDITLIESLKTLAQEFVIYPCGGDPQTDRGFRIQDIYLVNYVNSFKPDFKSNMLGVGTKINVDLKEV